MKNLKLTATALFLTIAFVGAFCEAQAKDKSASSKSRSRRAAKSASVSTGSVEYKVRRYAAIYGLDEETQAKLTKMFEAQKKDLSDHERLYAPKNQAVDDQIAKVNEEIAKVNEQIAKLREKIAELAKSKLASAEALKELKLDHKAELDTVITNSHKIARIANSFKTVVCSNASWKYLPKETQGSFERQCQEAASELAASGEIDSVHAVRAAQVKLTSALAKAITPELRKTAEREQLKEYVVRGLVRYGLTEDQKTQIGALCAKSIADRNAARERYNQLGKDYDALRRAMSKYKSSVYYRELRTEAIKSVMTEEQREKLPAKYRASSKKVKKDKSSSKKAGKKATL